MTSRKDLAMSQVLIQTKNLEITPAIEEFANKNVSKLFRFDKKLSRVEFYLELAGTTGEDQTVSKLKMVRDGKDLFVKETDVKLYDAIKKSVEHAKEMLIDEKNKELDKNAY